MKLPVFIFSFITVTASAQVGIGTVSPSQALDIESANGSQTAIDINNTSTGDPVVNFQLGGTSTFSIGVDNSDGSKFKIGTSDIATSTAITIDGSQQVGIGTASPSQRLEVQGNVAIQNGTTSAASLFLYENATNGANYVLLTAPSAITTNYTFTIPVDAGINGQVLVTDGSGTMSWVTASTGDLEAANNLSDVANAATARTNLGLAIGTDVQAYDAQLDDIAGLTPTDGNIVIGNGTNFILENGATARTSLGLAIGTDVQAYDAQLDAIAGLTPSDGNIVIGDGANFILESGATARTSLGLAIGTDVQAYDADLDDLATGVFNEAGADADFRIEGVADTEVFFVDASTDRVGISTIAPGYTLDVAGDINYSGAITNASDKRYKKDIHKINDALSLINQFDGYTYKYRKEEFPKLKFDTTLQIGFIAQELNKVLPELVSQNDSGYYSVDYVKVTPVLLMAVKEQQATIDALEAKIVQLETASVQSSNTESTNDYNTLLERIQALEALLIQKRALTVAK